MKILIDTKTELSNANYFVGMELKLSEDKSCHITVTWLGKITMEKLEDLCQDLSNVTKLPLLIKFNNFDTLGKPEDIAKGRGLLVRKCELLDKKYQSQLLEFHKKWYYHEEGEAEERKTNVKYHVTVSPGKISKEVLEQLSEVSCTDIYIKQVGGQRVASFSGK